MTLSARIFFFGDVGASVVDETAAGLAVQDFDAHLTAGRMEAFHRRYMSNNKVCCLWVQMVRGLDVAWIVLQHGASFKGKEMVNRFLDGFEKLECGTDLLTEADFRIP